MLSALRLIIFHTFSYYFVLNISQTVDVIFFVILIFAQVPVAAHQVFFLMFSFQIYTSSLHLCLLVDFFYLTVRLLASHLNSDYYCTFNPLCSSLKSIIDFLPLLHFFEFVAVHLSIYNLLHVFNAAIYKTYSLPLHTV